MKLELREINLVIKPELTNIAPNMISELTKIALAQNTTPTQKFTLAEGDIAYRAHSDRPTKTK
jgi:hypothetical protein